MSEPISQIEVNKAVRVLKGKPLKFTATILFKDGVEVELQMNEQASIDYNEHARAAFYRYDCGGTGYTWLCKVDDVRVMRIEKTEAE